MKPKLHTISAVILICLLSSCATSMSLHPDANRVRKQIDHLMSTCRNYDYRTATRSILYRGKEKSRNWNEVLNSQSYDDKKQAVLVCDQVRKINQDSNFRQWSSYKVRTDEHGEWHDQTIDFMSSDGWHKYTFSLKQIGEFYALGQIHKGELD